IFAEMGRQRLDFVRDLIKQHTQDNQMSSFQDLTELIVAIAKENERQSRYFKYCVTQLFQRPAVREIVRNLRSELMKILIEQLQRIKRLGGMPATKHSN